MGAALGRKEEALRERQRAIELLPFEKDSINGAHMIEFFAITAAWAGEKDLACEKLVAALRLNVQLSHGQLKLLPLWDPLRGDLCFEKIVAHSRRRQRTNRCLEISRSHFALMSLG